MLLLSYKSNDTIKCIKKPKIHKEIHKKNIILNNYIYKRQ